MTGRRPGDRLQERKGRTRRFNRVMAVPAQLDVDPTPVADLAQGGHDVGEIDLALAEHQVVVNAPLHVLDVNVPETVLPPADVGPDGRLAHADQVTDVEGQAEVAAIHLAVQFGEFVHRVDEHAWLRLERQSDPAVAGEIGQPEASLD
jgi:hypothetical protein